MRQLVFLQQANALLQRHRGKNGDEKMGSGLADMRSAEALSLWHAAEDGK